MNDSLSKLKIRGLLQPYIITYNDLEKWNDIHHLNEIINLSQLTTALLNTLLKRLNIYLDLNPLFLYGAEWQIEVILKEKFILS